MSYKHYNTVSVTFVLTKSFIHQWTFKNFIIKSSPLKINFIHRREDGCLYSRLRLSFLYKKRYWNYINAFLKKICFIMICLSVNFYRIKSKLKTLTEKINTCYMNAKYIQLLGDVNIYFFKYYFSSKLTVLCHLK